MMRANPKYHHKFQISDELKRKKGMIFKRKKEEKKLSKEVVSMKVFKCKKGQSCD
jgi:hypothetical protein